MDSSKVMDDGNRDENADRIIPEAFRLSAAKNLRDCADQFEAGGFQSFETIPKMINILGLVAYFCNSLDMMREHLVDAYKRAEAMHAPAPPKEEMN